MAAFRSNARRNARLVQRAIATVLRAFRACLVALNARNPRPPRIRIRPSPHASTNGGKGKRGIEGGGQFLPPPPSPLPRVIIRGEWTISGAAATAHHRLVMPRIPLVPCILMIP